MTRRYHAQIQVRASNGNWEDMPGHHASGTNRFSTARDAAYGIPLGYGGHNRSERALDALARGNEIVTPLGEYRVILLTEEEAGERNGR